MSQFIIILFIPPNCYAPPHNGDINHLSLYLQKTYLQEKVCWNCEALSQVKFRQLSKL